MACRQRETPYRFDGKPSLFEEKAISLEEEAVCLKGNFGFNFSILPKEKYYFSDRGEFARITITILPFIFCYRTSECIEILHLKGEVSVGQRGLTPKIEAEQMVIFAIVC